MINFSAIPAPGLVSRLRVCRPGEQLLWATTHSTFYFDVEGLDQLGNPRKSMLNRGVRAVGRGVGDFALELAAGIVFGATDEGSADRPPSADHILFGPGPGCLAHQAVPAIGTPGRAGVKVWTLTSQRLVVSVVRVREAEPEPEKSFLGKTMSFGKDLVDFGVDVAKIVAGSYHDYGPNKSGEPVAVPEVVRLHEFPRAQIGGVGPFERKGKPCLRVSLVDGSGVDFVFPQPEFVHRAVELTNGAR
ncbi:hypothetical protein [Saccharothrix variisporea]|uniref:Uncharacterized protein n=1 Tax=Saccharothrix variisporea TaxID=543527 RepID=A0A495XM59_9PSEU|nr:hypothetical protein [Saccharothrix variisporea]RKT74006.1 hypothetical protein DFJ66_7348 [Saccharothrix variisporea]